jgi:hypothetical protein
MFDPGNAPLRRGRTSIAFDRNVEVFKAVARLYRDGEWSLPSSECHRALTVVPALGGMPAA